MARQITKRLRAALERVNHSMNSHDGSKYARGFASEGYLGGYAQALRDIDLLLNGVEPNDNRGFWGEDTYLAEQVKRAKQEAKKT